MFVRFYHGPFCLATHLYSREIYAHAAARIFRQQMILRASSSQSHRLSAPFWYPLFQNKQQAKPRTKVYCKSRTPAPSSFSLDL